MASRTMTPALLERVAERFRVLGEPTRLRLLQALREGERTVGELADETGLGQTNASRQLAHLHAMGFVSRRKEGLYVVYALADEMVFALCDIICGRIEDEAEVLAGLVRGSEGRGEGTDD